MLHWLHYQRAKFYLALRRHDDALAAWRAALAVNPRYAPAAAAAGFHEAEHGHWASAAQFLQQALDIESDNADFWFNLGYVHEKQDQDAEAIHCFERAVALRRGLDRAWFGLGLAHRRCGKLAEAAQALKVAAELQPMNPHAFYELATVQLELDNLAEVDRIIRHVSGFDPEMTRRLVRETGRRPEDVQLR